MSFQIETYTPIAQPLTLYEEGTIIAARPLNELFEHVKNFKTPSWELVQRAVAVIFKSILTHSFCDKVALLRPEAVYHSFKGRVEVIKSSGAIVCSSLRHMPIPYFTKDDLTQFDVEYPYLLQSALYYRVDSAKVLPVMQSKKHGFRHISVLDYSVACIPDFTKYDTFSPQTIRQYFSAAWGVELTGQNEGNTVTDLVKSNILQATDCSEVYNFKNS